MLAMPVPIVSFAAEPVKVIALTGQAAPGATGATFKSFGGARINGLGQTVFSATLDGAPATADSGVWLGGSSQTPFKVVREGDTAVGTSIPTTYSDFRTDIGVIDAFNDSGKVALSFVGLRSGTSSAGFGNFTGAAGALTLINRNGEPHPSPYTGNWNGKQFVALNNSGTLAVGELYDAGWIGRSGASLARFLKSAEPAPGLPGATIYEAYPGTIALNDSNQFVANARITGTSSAVFAGTSAASFTRFIAPGDPAPWAAAASTVYAATFQSLGRNGNVLLDASVIDATHRVSPGLVLGTVTGGPQKQIYTYNTQIPGFAAGSQLSAGNAILAGNEVYLSASLSGPTGSAQSIWRLVAGRPQQIAIQNTQVPGESAGTKFGELFHLNTNESGQMAFMAKVIAPGGTQSSALFGYDPIIGLVRLIKQGEGIQIAPGQTRIIQSFVAGVSYEDHNGQDGLASPLNDYGQLTYSATFTDSSQAVLTTLIPFAGDTNDDGSVDNTDLKTLLANYKKPGGRAQGDFNGDGVVGFKDFQLLEQNFGRHPPVTPAPSPDLAELSAAAEIVPEPATPACIFAGAITLLRRRKRTTI